MSAMSHLRLPQAYLCPDELRIAAKAYDAALHSIPDNNDVEPHAARKLLARFVIERALRGDRNPEGMRDGALRCLERYSGGPMPRTPIRAAETLQGVVRQQVSDATPTVTAFRRATPLPSRPGMFPR